MLLGPQYDTICLCDKASYPKLVVIICHGDMRSYWEYAHVCITTVTLLHPNMLSCVSDER